jgi:signal transduction histidine kinase
MDASRESRPLLRRLGLRRLAARLRGALQSLTWRMVLLATLLIAAGTAGSAVTIGSLYRAGIERQFDQILSYDLDELIGRTREGEKGALSIDGEHSRDKYQDATRGWYWQVQVDGKVVAASSSLQDVEIQLAPPRVGETLSYNVPGPPGLNQNLRVFAKSLGIGQPPKQVVYIVAGDWSDVQAEVEAFSRNLFTWVAAFGLGLVLTMLATIWFGLGPLRRIPGALADIRSGASDRLTGTFPREVQPLVREINALLDHNARIVERARTHVGNLAHALKTPLAVLGNEAEAPGAELARAVKAQTEVMRRQVEHHLARARMAARAGILGARTSVMPVLEGLQRTLEKIYARRGVAIAVAGPPAAAFRGEKQDLEEILGNLMDNACKWSGGEVRATVRVVGDRLVVEVEDDGPGIPENKRTAAFKRGFRLDETTPGSGLGLSIVHDTAEIYGGALTLGESALGGLKATLDLPAAGDVKR